LDEWPQRLLAMDVIYKQAFSDLTICYTCYTIPCMDEQYTQLRIRRTTLRKLKLAGALNGEKLIDLIDRWATEELKKLGYEDVQVQALPVEKE
jgi:hypothetical protein